MKIDPIIIKKKIIDETRKRVDEAVAAFLKTVPDEVNKALRGTVRSYLGIKGTSFGRIEFAKDSIVYKLISNRAKEVVEKLAGTLVWEPTAEELNKVKTEALHVYRKSLQGWVNSQMRTAAERRIKAFEEEFMGIDICLEPVRLPTLDEMANPEYGKTELEKMLMEAQMETIEKPKLKEPHGFY
ncbi:MAG: hypothetical protein ACW99J_18355 [Candidatus Thorarchaeota archaeon]|jgi:hypothetical protein